MSVSAQQASEAWVRGMSGAAEKVKQGVMGVTVAPTATAAARADYWQQRVSDPETRQAFVRGCQAYTLADWQRAMVERGAGRMASGAAAARATYTAAMSEVLPYLEQVVARVRAMPADTLEDRIQRMVAQTRGMAAFRRRG